MHVLRGMEVICSFFFGFLVFCLANTLSLSDFDVGSLCERVFRAAIFRGFLIALIVHNIRS